jgi:hypothetical protein
VPRGSELAQFARHNGCRHIGPRCAVAGDRVHHIIQRAGRAQEVAGIRDASLRLRERGVGGHRIDERVGVAAAVAEPVDGEGVAGVQAQGRRA